jgi:hypothetical protein
MGDLFLVDLASEKITQLTNDRFADLQPTWSPDGKSIAWVTDRASTNFDIMKWGDLRLAVMDLDTRTIRSLATFSRGRSINPQYSPDGRNLFFIADQDGVPDIYRLDLATNATYRLTRVATGVSGITSDSPALSIARGNGRMAFTVFKDQGFGIFALEPSQQEGKPETGLAAGVPVASELPPVTPSSRVSQYLADPQDGLPSGRDFEVAPYHSQFSLDAIGQPSFGASFGGPFGAGLVGGISALWGDQLGDRQIFGAIQANGTVKDIGGAVQYYNLKNRWNWGATAQHIPYPFTYLQITPTTYGNSDATNVSYILQRIYFDNLGLIAQYPFSTTRRFEFSLSGTHQGYEREVVDYTYVGGALVNQSQRSSESFPGITYAEPSAALVGDNSFAAYTSPVAGERYRLQAAPVVGDFRFTTVTADYRRYFFMRPFSLAMRGMHMARYGRDEQDSRLWPLFLGDETLIRGYGYGSFRTEECPLTANGNSTCPVFDRLFGSRLLVANTEFRIPLLGSPEFGLLNFPFLPLEVSPFFDAGVSYTASQPPDIRFTREGGNADPGCVTPATSSTAVQNYIVCTDRIPVMSTGLSFRVNVLGYLIFESYVAHPFQRPGKNWVWGFQLAPGW